MARPTYDELVADNQHLREVIRERDAQVDHLSSQVDKLMSQVEMLKKRVEQLVEQLEKSRRGSKRQAAPFSKGQPKTNPKRPGRKPGKDYGTKAFRAVPPVIDETYEAPLPSACPCCGGEVVFDHTAQQYQEEMPRRPIYRQFNVEVGQCSRCQKRVQGRHPLQTSDALGCCASQVGPEAQAAVVQLNKELGLSQGKISRLFQTFFGLKLTRGGSCQIMLRSAERLKEDYGAIVNTVQASPWIVPDETGWRIGGISAWLHTAVGQQAIAYRVDPRRGYEAAVKLIGEGYAGRMIHDGWSPYDRFWRADHQTCLSHLLERCKGMLQTAVAGAVRLPRQVKALLQESLAVRDQRDAGQISESEAVCRAIDFESRMEKLIEKPKTNEANERLAAHLWNHRDELFTFLLVPGLDATNWRAEQAIRGAVVNRKVWGGNRTLVGAAAQGILLSVIATARLRGVQVIDYIAERLRGLPGELMLPPQPPG